MLFALMLIASAADWVPMRWTSADPKSLELVKDTAINCLLLERGQWSPEFAKAAADRGIATLGVVRAESDSVDAAIAAKLNGVVLEGNFDATVAERLRNRLTDSRLAVVELPERSRMKLEAGAPIIGTYQGVWPGIQVEEGGVAKAAPSGAPWIDTNMGFIRFVRAATNATVWMGNRPPEKMVIKAERYLQAICDAEVVGGKWVIALDSDFNKRLFANDAAALQDWKRITQQVGYFESHREWKNLRPAGQLALVQDVASGGLLSGGILDMIAVKHTPVRPVPSRKLDGAAMDGSKMAVNVDPGSLNDEQKEILKKFTRAGNTLLTAPPGWKFPAPKPGQITLGNDEVKVLDEIWKELNTMTGRRNLGARLFNVSSMLSNLVQTADGKKTVLQLVNFSDFPAEAVTVHLLGKYRSAKIYFPDAPAKVIPVYDNDEGTGIDIDKIGVSATLVLE
jgi:hypothetical protein